MTTEETAQDIEAKLLTEILKAVHALQPLLDLLKKREGNGATDLAELLFRVERLLHSVQARLDSEAQAVTGVRELRAEVQEFKEMMLERTAGFAKLSDIISLE